MSTLTASPFTDGKPTHDAEECECCEKTHALHVELEALRDQGAAALDAAGDAFEDMKRRLAEVTAERDSIRQTLDTCRALGMSIQRTADGERWAVTNERALKAETERDAALGSEAAMRGLLTEAEDFLGKPCWEVRGAVGQATCSHSRCGWIENARRLASRPTGYRSPEAVEALLLKGMELALDRGLRFDADLKALVAELLKEGQPS